METMHRSPLARALHWWWTRLTRTEASPACATSIASINPCPGDRGVFALQATADFDVEIERDAPDRTEGVLRCLVPASPPQD